MRRCLVFEKFADIVENHIKIFANNLQENCKKNLQLTEQH